MRYVLIMRLVSPHELPTRPFMLWRTHNPQRSLRSLPPGFINPCRPIVSKQPPRWVHEVKHDGTGFRFTSAQVASGCSQ